MKEQINLLSDSLKNSFSIYSITVAVNYEYLKSIGITNPELLITVVPDLFLCSREDLKNSIKNIDINEVNENPISILDMIE